ncbi:MAG: MFS transporter [Bacteroidota bacterium]
MITFIMLKKSFRIFALVLAGEVVFLLPFVLIRVFRPTFLKVFQITNFELGSAFATYGVVAMISYFFGGPLADRYSARKLVSLSLIITSLGGIFMASVPSMSTLIVLYGFWGLTTILLFWAAFTKATRLTGGDKNQGNTFGLVDGGRGLIVALLASGSVLILGSFLPENVESASIGELSNALSMVIIAFSVVTFLTAGVTWVTIEDIDNKKIITEKISWKGVKNVVNKRSIWQQSLILLCAYVGYKCTDDFSLFASEVLLFNDVNAAHAATVAFWSRPFAAISAGYLGDRFGHSKMTAICFGLIIIGSLIIYSGLLKPGLELGALLILASTGAAIFGLRGLYYALFQESKVPVAYTGSAVGVVSVIGFTPDIFFGPMMGYILDSSPGAAGHENLFGILSLFSLIGLLTALNFRSKP